MYTHTSILLACRYADGSHVQTFNTRTRNTHVFLFACMHAEWEKEPCTLQKREPCTPQQKELYELTCTCYECCTPTCLNATDSLLLPRAHRPLIWDLPFSTVERSYPRYSVHDGEGMQQKHSLHADEHIV